MFCSLVALTTNHHYTNHDYINPLMYICDRILENLPSTHKRQTKLQVFHYARNEILIKQPDISVRDTLNYQNKCRNTFGWLVGLSYKVAKLDILIISLVCRW